MSIGFKEWALVCSAMAEGRQSIILRKGGIAEGRAGFRFEHPEFFLFPTLFHEQAAKLKVPGDTTLPALDSGVHRINLRAVVEWTCDLPDWEQVLRLESFHIWTEKTLRERFEYDTTQGLSLAFVRVYKLSSALEFADEPKYGGCRSWVKIPDFVQDTVGAPVMEEAEHRATENRVRACLAGI
jgi:hypothetical protein